MIPTTPDPAQEARWEALDAAIPTSNWMACKKAAVTPKPATTTEGARPMTTQTATHEPQIQSALAPIRVRLAAQEARVMATQDHSAFYVEQQILFSLYDELRLTEKQVHYQHMAAQAAHIAISLD